MRQWISLQQINENKKAKANELSEKGKLYKGRVTNGVHLSP